MSDAGVSKPRRHFSTAGDERDRSRTDTRLLVSDQRQPSDFSGTMAALAMLREDRQHIAIKSRRSIGWRRGGFTWNFAPPRLQSGNHRHGKNRELKMVARHGPAELVTL